MSLVSWSNSCVSMQLVVKRQFEACRALTHLIASWLKSKEKHRTLASLWHLRQLMRRFLVPPELAPSVALSREVKELESDLERRRLAQLRRRPTKLLAALWA